MHKINQILFVIPEDKMVLVPAKVVRVTTVETADGQQTETVAEAPGNKLFSVSKFKGQVFISLDQAQQQMESTAMQSIQRMINRAAQLAKNMTPSVSAPAAAAQHQPPQDELETEADLSAEEENGVVRVTLPDGTPARVKLPQNLQ